MIDSDPLNLSNHSNGHRKNDSSDAHRGPGDATSTANSTTDNTIVDIQATNKFGWNSFTCCCVNGDYELAMDLIALGVATSLIDAEGYSPLQRCCQRGHSDIVLALLVLGHDINTVGPEKEGKLTLLHSAISNGHAHTSMILIERGCNIDSTCVKGSTPLYLAAKYGMVEVVKSIARRIVGETCLSTLLSLSKIEVGSEGGNTNSSSKKNEKKQKKERETDLVQRKKLRKHLQKCTNNGDTPLHAAVHSGMIGMASLLLALRADILSTGEGGDTVLHAACRRNASNGTMVAYLLSEIQSIRTHSANSNMMLSVQTMLGKCNDKGESALHVAAASQAGGHAINAICVSIQELKLDDVTLRFSLLNQQVDDNGDTPLHIACKFANHDAAVTLVKWGADLNIRNKNGHTALQTLFRAQIAIQS